MRRGADKVYFSSHPILAHSGHFAGVPAGISGSVGKVGDGLAGASGAADEGCGGGDVNFEI